MPIISCKYLGGFIFLLLDYLIETLLDSKCIKYVLEHFCNEMVCILDNDKMYAVITSNGKYHYCLETKIENTSYKRILTVLLDRIKCFSYDDSLEMERVKFDELKREGIIYDSSL